MDVSLDAYIRKKPSMKRGQGLGAKNRLGGKFSKNVSSPNLSSRRNSSKQSALAKTFDARQKLSANFTKKRPLNISSTKAYDARQKLNKKAKLSDARQKILAKKAAVVQDARQKILSKKRKQITDARDRIKAKGKGAGGPRVKVTGLGGKVVGTGRKILTGTNNRQNSAGDHSVGLMSDGNIVISAKNRDLGGARERVKAWTKGQARPRTDPNKRVPIVRIQNDIYRPPSIRIQNDLYREPATYSHRLTSSPAHVGVRIDNEPVERLAAPSPIRPLNTKRTLSDRLSARISTRDFETQDEGHRVLVTNLHPIVTQEDIVELFSAIGSLRKARLVRDGLAEVVFVNKDDALMAIKKYHNRELDGVPMQVKMPVGPKPQPPPRLQPEVMDIDEELVGTLTTSAPLLLGRHSQTQSEVEVGSIHKALFKTKDGVINRPVTFTIKL